MSSKLTRLEKADRLSQNVMVELAAAESVKRKRLLQGWGENSLPGDPDWPSGVAGDYRFLVMAQESVYQYELRHGPLTPNWPPHFETSDLMKMPASLLLSISKYITIDPGNADMIREYEALNE
jgi:hypothetical protein